MPVFPLFDYVWCRICDCNAFALASHVWQLPTPTQALNPGRASSGASSTHGSRTGRDSAKRLSESVSWTSTSHCHTSRRNVSLTRRTTVGHSDTRSWGHQRSDVEGVASWRRIVPWGVWSACNWELSARSTRTSRIRVNGSLDRLSEQ